MPRALAAAAIAALGGIVGAALTLGLGRAAGWLDSSTHTVVVRPVQQGRPSPAAVKPARARIPLLFDAQRIYARRSPGVVTIYSSFPSGEQGQGSGFVVSRQGYVLTNAHVVTTAPQQPLARAKELYVEFSDGDRVKGTVSGYDLFSDVALVKIDAKQHRLVPLPLGDSSTVVVGEPVATIGSPFGNENSLSVGVVSAKARSISSITSEYQLVDAIQTDAAINHGTSGGPLVDADGRVIGISAQIRSSTGQGEGVGFAVPINTAKRSLRQLLRHGRVSYAYVGIKTDDLTPSLAKHLHDPVSYGALITCVTRDGPGSGAGLRGGTDRTLFEGSEIVGGGDVVVAIDGHRVRSGQDVVRLIGQRLAPGDSAVFTVVRSGERKRISVKLAERPTQPSQDCV